MDRQEKLRCCFFQTLLSQDSDVQALAEYLDTEENLDAGLLTVLIDNIATKPNLQSVIAKGEETLPRNHARRIAHH